MAQAAASRIFRQSALDRLSSPEQLDRLITLTRPRDWISAAALILIIVLAGIWSVLGTIPTRVKGSGIFIATGGNVVDAVAIGDGTLLSLQVPTGQTVRKGDVIARIEQPELDQTLANARAVVREREEELANLKSQVADRTAAMERSLAARKQLLTVRARDADARAKTLEEEVGREEPMFAQHLITWQKLSDSRQALAMARQEALDARSQINQADSDDIAARNSNDRDIRSATERLDDARRKASDVELQIQQRAQILSPASGRVTEWKAVPGTHVAAGQALISIESGVTGLQLLLYLPSDQGKQVQPGMEVRVSPSTVRKEEFGTIIGTVTDVSDFPSTPQAMLAVLQNDRLVQQLSPKGPPFAAHIALKTDPATRTGYAWTGGVGPDLVLTSGTLADGEVTIEQHAPITFIVPWLRKVTGLAQ